MFNGTPPVQGSVLISEPFMLDPNFERSVIMLCEHNEDGTLGLVLNQSSNLLLSDVLEGIDNDGFPLYVGGPVQANALFFLHQAYGKLSSGTRIGQNLYWGGDFDRLLLLINEELIEPEEVKFFLGYSGWSAGQLDKEIEQNSWAVHPEFDNAIAFVADGEDLWKQALISLGPKYAHVAQFPKSPNWN